MISPEDPSRSHDKEAAGLRQKYPILSKTGRRVTVDWTGIKDPSTFPEVYVGPSPRMGPKGPEAELYRADANGNMRRWWVPVDQIFDNEN